MLGVISVYADTVFGFFFYVCLFVFVCLFFFLAAQLDVSACLLGHLPF